MNDSFKRSSSSNLISQSSVDKKMLLRQKYGHKEENTLLDQVAEAYSTPISEMNEFYQS